MNTISEIEKTYTQSEVDNILFSTYAKLARSPLRDLSSSSSSSSTTFSKFTKSDIIGYLKNPKTNEKNIRNASIYMYNNSSHYMRLINYYALMATWSYIIVPSKYDLNKKDIEAYKKQYLKISHIVENMNLKHELQKVAKIAFREDVYYGVCWESSDSFFMQKINPDWCEISSIEDGVYNFAIDMSRIKENELNEYPPGITTMYNEYKRSGQKLQEVPSDISACFKVNEDFSYPLPLFSGTMVLLHDIEDYKALVKQRTEIGNYKLLNLVIPSKDGELTMLWDDVLKYYNILNDVLPEGIGLGVSPMKMDTVDFDRNAGLADTNEVYKSEEQFWSASGTSPLLFGGGNKNSSSALKLSTKTDEEIVFAFMEQCQRWVNRKLKSFSGSIKFKLRFLPITYQNMSDMIKLYKEAASLGLPVKSAYYATLGMESTDIVSMCALENDILNIPENFIPLSSSYTQSSLDQESGRPTAESKGEQLTPEGEQTLDDDTNSNRA